MTSSARIYFFPTKIITLYIHFLFFFKDLREKKKWISFVCKEIILKVKVILYFSLNYLCFDFCFVYLNQVDLK